MDVFFQSYTCLIYSKCSEQLSDFVLYCKLIHTREPWYQVSVRQARSLPKTSFRLHLAMNTLVVGWTLPAVRARWGLTPVRIRSCWANHKKRSSYLFDNYFFFEWCHQESNRGHKDFQSFALPTELWHQLSQIAIYHLRVQR